MFKYEIKYNFSISIHHVHVALNVIHVIQMEKTIINLLLSKTVEKLNIYNRHTSVHVQNFTKKQDFQRIKGIMYMYKIIIA